MRIGENHPGRRQPIQPGRGNFSGGIQRTHIAVSEVIGQNINNVRRAAGRRPPEGA